MDDDEESSITLQLAVRESGQAADALDDVMEALLARAHQRDGDRQDEHVGQKHFDGREQEDCRN